MNDEETLERLYNKWRQLAIRCPATARGDAEDAVAEALDVALKKPLRVQQAVAVFQICLLRVQSRRCRRSVINFVPKEQLESLPFKDDDGGTESVGPLTTPEKLQQAIAQLPPREQRFVRQLYFSPMRPTFTAIARKEKISRQRVQQVVHQAITRLRVIIEGN